jgi:hypothetical protein
VHRYRFPLHPRSLESLKKYAEYYCGIRTEPLAHLRDSILDKTPDLWAKLFPILCACNTSSASWQHSEMTMTSNGVKSFSLRFIFEIIERSVGESVEYL